MSWDEILSEEDFRLFKENIFLLEEQVINHFSNVFEARDILKAIRNVPRHFFVSPEYRYLAYTDNAFPTCRGLTTSAPSVIAEMIFRSGISRGDRLLEIGTGTGYEAAVLSDMGVHVYTIEIDRAVAEAANRILSQLGYKIDNTIRNSQAQVEAKRVYSGLRRLFPHRGRIELLAGNGAGGLPDHAPYNAIIIAAAVRRMEDISALRTQLQDRGRLLFMFGSRNSQMLHIVERRNKEFMVSVLEGTTYSFVPLVPHH